MAHQETEDRKAQGLLAGMDLNYVFHYGTATQSQLCFVFLSPKLLPLSAFLDTLGMDSEMTRWA